MKLILVILRVNERVELWERPDGEQVAYCWTGARRRLTGVSDTRRDRAASQEQRS